MSKGLLTGCTFLAAHRALLASCGLAARRTPRRARRGRCIPRCQRPVLNLHRSSGAMDGGHFSAARCLCPRSILSGGSQQSNLRRHRARACRDVLRLDLVLPLPGGRSARVERSGTTSSDGQMPGSRVANTPTVRGVIESQSAERLARCEVGRYRKVRSTCSHVARLLACPSITVGMTSRHSDCRREAGRPSPPVT